MKIEQFSKLLTEKSWSSVRRVPLKLEIRRILKDLMYMEVYEKFDDDKLLDVFMQKFKRMMKSRNLDEKFIKELAKNEIESLRNRQ
jgi:hypothetical protein